MSVRSKPTREQITAAEALYQDINAGKVKLGPQGKTGKFLAAVSSMNIKQKFTALMSVVALMFVVLGFVLYSNIDSAKDSVELLAGGLGLTFSVMFVLMWSTSISEGLRKACVK